MANSGDIVGTSGLVDPLADYTPFSLNLSSSFRHLANPNNDSLLTHLKHLAVRNPDTIVKQAKAIIEGGMDVIENDETMALSSEDQNEIPFTTSDKSPQRRRPGLSLKLKKPKFTLKPLPTLPSQADTFPEPTMDMDLKDPEEFFAAFERMEYAKEELRRLRGEPEEEIDVHNISFSSKILRPSLFGKTATFKFRSYPSLGVPGNVDPVLSSQKANDQHNMIPTNENAIAETNATNISPRKKRVPGVKPAKGKKVSELDKLLSYSYDELGEGVKNYVQNTLNVKPVEFRKLSLPEMPDVHGREALPKMTDSISHVPNRASSNSLNFSYNFKKNSSSNHVSPSLPKSPLASISSLNKHLSKTSPSKDPFSPIGIDSSQGVSTYSETRNWKQGDQIGKTTDSQELSKFPVNGKETHGAVSPPRIVGNSIVPTIETEEQLDGVGYSYVNVTSDDSLEIERSPTGREENIALSETMPSPIANDATPIDDPEECSKSPTDGEEDLPVSGEAPLASAAEIVDLTSLIELEDQIAADPKPVGKESLSKGEALEKSSVDEADTHDDTLRKGRKKKGKASAPVQEEPKNKKRKVNENLRRQSLFEAGTKWEAGLRRSTRIRMRPLEYWRGERFLYGRVHKSLVTVIGVKYASPTNKAEKGALKVKSFVTDDYKDLVDLAASH